MQGSEKGWIPGRPGRASAARERDLAAGGAQRQAGGAGSGARSAFRGGRQGWCGEVRRAQGPCGPIFKRLKGHVGTLGCSLLKFLLLHVCKKFNKPVFKRKEGKRDGATLAGGRGRQSCAKRGDGNAP